MFRVYPLLYVENLAQRDRIREEALVAEIGWSVNRLPSVWHCDISTLKREIHCRLGVVGVPGFMIIRISPCMIMSTLPTAFLPDSRGVRHGGSADTLSGAVGREHEHRSLPGAAAVQQPNERRQGFANQYPEGGQGARCHERGARGDPPRPGYPDVQRSSKVVEKLRISSKKSRLRNFGKWIKLLEGRR